MSFPRINSESFSAFCRRLGAPLNNVYWSWSAHNPDLKRAVFTIWADRIQNRAIVLWDPESSRATRNGGRELKRIADLSVALGYETLGILCEAIDPTAPKRTRGYYDDQTLLVLDLTSTDTEVRARIVGEVPSAVRAGDAMRTARPTKYALDDLGLPPPGVDEPDRVWGISGGYRRDPRVREYVIQQAHGRCEYCRALGFALPNGSSYLEAHHILGLAALGPDTVANVVALCANHHREAHYGLERVELNTKLAKLKSGGAG